MVEYLRRKTIYQGVLLQSVYGQLPPRSWSTIKIRCHYSPQSLSTAAIRIHHQLPPRSWSTTTVRCQHDKGSAILDLPLRSLIRDPQVIIHDVATAVALDLRLFNRLRLYWRAWRHHLISIKCHHHQASCNIATYQLFFIKLVQQNWCRCYRGDTVVIQWCLQLIRNPLDKRYTIYDSASGWPIIKAFQWKEGMQHWTV